jgi:hypothetical protein
MGLEGVYQNYEPNYMAALMAAHPVQLDDAKKNYLLIVMTVFGDDYSGYIEWLKIHKEPLGPMKDT